MAISFGTKYPYQARGIEECKTTQLDETHFVSIYCDSSNYYGYAVIGTIASDESISYGLEYRFAATYALSLGVCALDSTHFAIVYDNNNNAGITVIGTVADSVISFGTSYNFNSNRATHSDIKKIDSATYLISFRDSANSSRGTCIIATVLNGVISFGTKSVFSTVQTEHTSIAIISASQFTITYRYSSTSCRVRVGTISGTTITYGSEYIPFGNVDDVTSTLLDSTHLLVTCQATGDNLSRLAAIVCTISDTVITLGRKKYIDIDVQASNTAITILNSTQFVISYKDNTNTLGKSVVGNYSNSDIFFEVPVVNNNANTVYFSMSLLTTNKILLSYRNVSTTYPTSSVATINADAQFTFGNNSTYNAAVTNDNKIISLNSTTVMMLYTDGGNSSYLTAIVGTISGTTVSYGSEYVVINQLCSYFDIAKLDETHVVIAYKNSSSVGKAVIGTVSNTNQISFGATVDFTSNVASSDIKVATSSPTKFSVLFQDANNTYYAGYKTGTVSGSTITFSFTNYISNGGNGMALAQISNSSESYINFWTSATPTSYVKYNTSADVSFYTGGVQNLSAVMLDSTHFAFAYKKPTTVNYGYVRIGLISGSTITLGNEICFNLANTEAISITNTSSTDIIISYIDPSINYGTTIQGTVNLTNLTVSIYANRFFGNITSAYQRIAVLSASKFVIAYKSIASTNYGTLIVAEKITSVTHELTSSISETSSSSTDLTQEVVEGILLTTTISQTSSSSVSAQKELLSGLDISETSSSSTAAQKELSAVSNISEETSVSTSLKQNLLHNAHLQIYQTQSVSENLTVDTPAQIEIGNIYTYTDNQTEGISACKIDGNRHLVCYKDFSGGVNGKAAVVVRTDKNVSACNAGWTYSAGMISNLTACCAISSTKSLIAYKNNSNYGSVKIATIDEFHAASFGTEYTFTSDVSYKININRLSDTQFIISWLNGSGAAYAAVGTISGNSISFGTSYSVCVFYCCAFSVAVLDSTHVAFSYNISGSGYTRAASVSGTSLNLGTVITFNTGGTYATSAIDIINSTKYILIYSDGANSYRGAARVISVSDTTASLNTEYIFTASQISQISVCAKSASSIAVSYIQIDNVMKSVCLTVSGTILTPSATKTLATSAAGMAIAPIDSLMYATVFYPYKSYENRAEQNAKIIYAQYGNLIPVSANIAGLSSATDTSNLERLLRLPVSQISSAQNISFVSKLLSAQITQISETSNALYKSLGLDLHIAQDAWVNSWIQKAQTIVLAVEQLSTSDTSVENIKAIQALISETSSSTAYLQMQKLLTSDISELSVAETALSLELGLATDISSTTTSVLKIISAWGLATEILSTSGSSSSLTLDLILFSLISQSSELTGVPAKTDLLKSDILSQLSQISTVDKIAVLKEYIVSTAQSSADLELTHLLMDWINANTSIEENITKTSDIITHLLSNASFNITPLLELYLTDEIFTTSAVASVNEILTAFRLAIASETELKFDSRRFADVAVLMQQATHSEISIDRYIELISNLNAEAKIFITSKKYSNLLAEINQDTTVAIRIQELIRAYLEYRSRLQQALTFDGLLHGQLSTSGQLNLQSLYFEGNIKNV